MESGVTPPLKSPKTAIENERNLSMHFSATSSLSPKPYGSRINLDTIIDAKKEMVKPHDLLVLVS